MAFAKAIAGVWLAATIPALCRRDKAKHDTAQHPVELVHGTTSAIPVPPDENRRSTSDMRGPLTIPPSESRWLAPLTIGLSLMARGEIGFLILGLAQDSGLVVDDGGGRDAYRITIWALLLTTLAGPIACGILLKIRKGMYARALIRGRWGIQSAADVL